MKKSSKIILHCLLTLLYAVLLGLLLQCVIYTLPLDIFAGFVYYPYLMSFCCAAGILALAGIVLLVFLEIKYSDKLSSTLQVFIGKIFCAVLLSLPMIKLWEMLFDVLRDIF